MIGRPTILVFGRIGQVGYALRHSLACLGRVIALDYPEVDFTSPDSIRGAIREVDPVVVVNAAAYTAVDKAESEPERAMAINGVAPGVLAEEAKRLKSIFVHYSTDYVFDGTKGGTYDENDTPNPLNVYGKTKLAGDRAVEAVGGRYLIFRTSWVYGSRGSNFLLTMLRLSQQRSELRIIDDQIGAPTSSESIATSTATVLAQLLSPATAYERGVPSGIYNVTNGGETSWFGFAREIFEKAAATGLRPPVLVPIRTSDYPVIATRPANSRLAAHKIAGVFGVYMPSWQEALSLVMETIAGQTSPSRAPLAAGA